MSISSNGITSTSAVISWGPPPYEDQNGVIISYTISVSVLETGESFTYTTSDPTLELTGLKIYTTYIIQVAASTSVGQGPFTQEFNITTLEEGNSKIYTICTLTLNFLYFSSH